MRSNNNITNQTRLAESIIRRYFAEHKAHLPFEFRGDNGLADQDQQQDSNQDFHQETIDKFSNRKCLGFLLKCDLDMNTAKLPKKQPCPQPYLFQLRSKLSKHR